MVTSTDTALDTASSRDGVSNILLDRYLLDELAANGIIDDSVRRASLDWLHPPHLWGHWAMMLLALFGTGLVLSGIVFFFAFNWASIPDLTKMLLVEAGVLLAAFGAWALSLERFVGRLLLLTAATLVGVFLAVFGQTYQTGADSWQLFALWALLVLPWTFFSRCSLLWCLWLGLVNLALMLWWDQAGQGAMISNYLLFLLQAAFMAVILLAREWLVLRWGGGRVAPAERKNDYWLSPPWTRWLLVVAILMALFPPLINWSTHLGTASTIMHLIGALSAVMSLTLFFAYRYWKLDLPALSLLLLMICVLVVFSLASILDDMGTNILATIFLTAVVAIAIFAGAAGYLKQLLAGEEGQHHG